MNAEIDISNTQLKTDRLLLRSFEEKDLDDLYTYASVDGVGQMAGWSPHKDKTESGKILDMFIQGKKTFALVYEGHVIGSLGIEMYNEQKYPELSALRCREIGYVLSKAYWGQGFMPEAVKEVIRYLFEEIGLDAVMCGHFLFNTQSRRVIEKTGFHFYAENTFQTAYGTTEKCLDYILKKEDWKKKCCI